MVDPFVYVAIGIGLLGEAPGLPAVTAATGLTCSAVAVVGVLHITRSVPFPHLAQIGTHSAGLHHDWSPS